MRIFTSRTKKDATARMHEVAAYYKKRGFSLEVVKDVRREWMGGPEKVLWDCVSTPLVTR